jgi:hypothetical protein
MGRHVDSSCVLFSTMTMMTRFLEGQSISSIYGRDYTSIERRISVSSKLLLPLQPGGARSDTYELGENTSS